MSATLRWIVADFESQGVGTSPFVCSRSSPQRLLCALIAPTILRPFCAFHAQRRLLTRLNIGNARSEVAKRSATDRSRGRGPPLAISARFGVFRRATMRSVSGLRAESRRAASCAAGLRSPPKKSGWGTEDQRRVRATEAERVGERIADLFLTRFQRNQVEITLGIWFVQVERGREHALA